MRMRITCILRILFTTVKYAVNTRTEKMEYVKIRMTLFII